MLALILSGLCWAGSLSGIEMPDSITSENQELLLNGMGLREKMTFRIYVAGLYVPFESKDAKRILRPSVAKQIRCEMVFPKVPKARMVSTMMANLEKNPEISPKVSKMMKSLLMKMDDLKKGDQMVFDYTPKHGLKLKINGQVKGHETDPDFVRGVFGMYLGNHPVSEGLKQGLLGKNWERD